MTDRNKTEDRDKVLFAFHQECARPTAEQIIAWVKRFPEFAEDIRAHAAVAWDWAAREMSTVCTCHGMVYLDCPNRKRPAARSDLELVEVLRGYQLQHSGTSGKQPFDRPCSCNLCTRAERLIADAERSG